MNFGIMPNINMPELHVRYETTFSNTCAGDVELLMEPGSVVGKWSLNINDSEPIQPDAFSSTTSHVRGSLSVDITPYLKAGSNTLAIDLITNRLDGGLLNPLYLAGNFGVQTNPTTITEQAQTGQFETYEANGLPFYAGIIEYETNFELDTIPNSENILASLDFQETFLEACEISINNNDWQPLLWSPYTCNIPKNNLNTGSNTLQIRVYTSLIRSFEGQRFNHDTHSYEDIAL